MKSDNMMCVLAFYRGNTLKKTEKDVSRDRKTDQNLLKVGFPVHL